MAFDFKKECKELYKPASKPSIVTVPPMSYVAVRGKGDPNTEGGEYQNALPLLYGIAYTVKMSKKGSRSIKGYFDFVVPPLEGFWWQDSPSGDIDYVRKDDFNFISCIRLPDFVTRDDFDWAVAEATTKKKLDFSAVELLKVDEGLCVQCMHTGPYDNEPATVGAMNEYTTRAMSPTSQTPVSITKSISPIHANVHRRNLRLWFVILSSALNSVELHLTR